MIAPLPLYKITDLRDDLNNQLEWVNERIQEPQLDNREFYRLLNARLHLKDSVNELSIAALERVLELSRYAA